MLQHGIYFYFTDMDPLDYVDWHVLFVTLLLSGAAAYRRTEWNSGRQHCWWRWFMEKETCRTVSKAFRIFTSSHPRAVDAWKRSSWKCPGMCFELSCHYLIPTYLMVSNAYVIYSCPLGCQNRNREDAYSNGWNWIGEEEASRCIQRRI